MIQLQTAPTPERDALAQLVERILTVYHRPLEEQLPQLESATRHVLEVHAQRNPELRPFLTRLVELVAALRADLEPHLRREEQLLFPRIVAGAGPVLGPAITAMLREHSHSVELLGRIRTHTDGFTAPPHACQTWRGVYDLLRQIETDLDEHMRLEAEELFPLALLG
jgi:regulator of cell morphogenesis and NO signaling